MNFTLNSDPPKFRQFVLYESDCKAKKIGLKQALTGVGSCELSELALLRGRLNGHQLDADTSTVSVGHVPRDLLTSEQVAGARCWAVGKLSRTPVITTMMMTC